MVNCYNEMVIVYSELTVYMAVGICKMPFCPQEDQYKGGPRVADVKMVLTMLLLRQDNLNRPNYDVITKTNRLRLLSGAQINGTSHRMCCLCCFNSVNQTVCYSLKLFRYVAFTAILLIIFYFSL